MSNINTTQLSTPSRIQSGTYKLTKKCFFYQSKLFEAQITELFDELWPTVTAIKNLRWQVNGYYHEVGVKTNSRLSDHFVDKEDKTNRPNLYRVCIDQSWEQQEYAISRNLLTNIFALYEGWLEMILPMVSSNSIKASRFQFPQSISNSISSIQNAPNNGLVDAFYDVYANKKESKLSNLQNYFRVYRYFKECRNSIIHRGGRADDVLIDAYNRVSNLTALDLDVLELPEMISVSSAGDFVSLSLRGVVGFSQIIIKIVEILDCEFIKADKAVDCFIDQLKEFNPYVVMLSTTNPLKMKSKINGIMQNAGFLTPIHTPAFYALLKSYGIVNC